MNDTARFEEDSPLRFAASMSLAASAGLALAIAAVIVVSELFPAIDIGISRLFFVEAACGPAQQAALACGSFPARSSVLLGHLRQVLQAFPFIVAIVLLATLLVRRLSGVGFMAPWMVACAAALWAYLISVGLMINVLLKGYGGRPRPVDTLLFGGELPFVTAGKFDGQCLSNCSFVSGEAASAFWLLCLVPLLPPRWRKAGAAAALAVAVVTSAGRLAFGAHFLSDIVTAGLLTWLVYCVICAVFLRTLPIERT